MPWILTDYTSKYVNLNDEKIYRDLQKPMGALNPKRLEYFLKRLQNLKGSGIPEFLYGSHYSSAGAVTYYLQRLEPFTKLSVEM